jgi:hypothetical protein
MVRDAQQSHTDYGMRAPWPQPSPTPLGWTGTDPHLIAEDHLEHADPAAAVTRTTAREPEQPSTAREHTPRPSPRPRPYGAAVGAQAVPDAGPDVSAVDHQLEQLEQLRARIAAMLAPADPEPARAPDPAPEPRSALDPPTLDELPIYRDTCNATLITPGA